MAVTVKSESKKRSIQTAAEAIGQCVLANRILANEKVLDAFGHVAVRNPENSETFFQSRSLSPELVTANDVLEIDLDGKVVTDTDMRPYAERFIYSAIFKARADVNAAVHGHPHSVIPFSTTGIPIRPIIHIAGMFFDGIPVYDEYDVSSGTLISTPEEGERVASALGQSRAVLLRGHGCCVVGDSVQSMTMAAIYLRDNAEIQLRALQLGKPKYLSPEEGKQSSKVMLGQLALDRAWNYWRKRAETAMPDIREARND